MTLEPKRNLLINYKTFEKEFLKVLNFQVPLKKKFVSSSQVPHLIKVLRKVVMKQFQLEIKYHRFFTIQNRNK